MTTVSSCNGWVVVVIGVIVTIVSASVAVRCSDWRVIGSFKAFSTTGYRYDEKHNDACKK